MELVRLNRRHKLFAEGCAYAWRFHGYNVVASRLELFLTKKFGPGFSQRGQAKWATAMGGISVRKVKLDGMLEPYISRRNVYWIGIKDPADLPFLLLQINDL